MRLIFIFFSCFFFVTIVAKPLDQVRTTPLPGTVALTFDDGPTLRYTPKILAILKKNRINATFFVMGWAAKKHPQLIRQIIADGNVVASHTNSHPMLTKISPQQLAREVIGPKEIIRNIIGKAPVCLRPPFGVSNERVRKFIRSKGLIPVPMGFNSFDYKKPGVTKLIHWVVSNAKSGRVFLLHDGYKGKEQTVEALPAIIKGIREKGLGFSVICKP